MKFISTIALLFVIHLSFGQQRQIQIEKADALKFKKSPNGQIQRLIGNVILKHDSVTMYCDSAHFYSTKNYFRAFGNVRMTRAEMLLQCDSMLYNGNTRMGKAIDRVIFIQDEMRMSSDLLYFSRNSKQIWYTNGADITQPDGQLYSKKGTYFTNQALFHFSDSVRIDQKDYTIESDSMHHWQNIDVSMFFGPTHIETDSQKVDMGYGWFDGKTESLRGGHGVKSVAPGRLLIADSMYYDGISSWAYAWNDVFLSDTTQGMRISSDYLTYNERQNKGSAYPNPLLVRKEEGDSIYLTADIIRVDSSLEQGVQFYAYNNALIYRSDFQASCDSLAYIENDSLIELFRSPVLWSEESQITADSIRLYLRNGELDYAELIENSFVISEDDVLQYNQLKGKLMIGYFKNSGLKKIDVFGNAETIYYARDEDEQLMGINKMICSDLSVWLKNGQVAKIQFKIKPEGSLFPEDQLIGAERRLRGFNDRFNERPTDPYQMRFRSQSMPEADR